jgi:soluble lytic murein transglycosylase-like protein
MLFIMFSLFALPASGQLTSYVDDRGNLVFTNADHPALRNAPTGVTMTAPAAHRTTPKQPVASPLTSPRTPATPAPEVLDRVVQQSAEKHHVDPALVRAVISTESNWNSAAVSRKGALGLMQLIPETAQRLGVANVFDPAQNVDAGVRYLGMLLERYNGDLNKALAAYNAGPGIVDRFGGVPNFRPGSDRQPRALEDAQPIYRTTESDGRIIFTNE